MDFNDTKDEANFRDEVNSWLSANADKKEQAKDIYRPVARANLENQARLKMLKLGKQKNMMLAGHVFTGLKITVDVMQLQWKE